MAETGIELERFQEELEVELRRIVKNASGSEAGPWARSVGCAAALIQAGGKRVRPRLCALSYLAAGGGTLGPGLVRFAAGIELLHTCMLIHDDVMDQSAVRRGVPAVHKEIVRSGVLTDERLAEGTAIVVGDVLATLATEQFVVEELDPALAREAAAVVHRAMRETAAGQILDLTFGGKEIEEVTEEEILLAYRLKTAYFAFEAPLRSGAVLARAGDAVADALADFGLRLGTAFQLRDDLVGFLGEQSITGKGAGDDLREGKKTMVLRLLWQRCGEAERDLIAQILGRREPAADELARLRDAAAATGAVADVEERVSALSQEAIAGLRSVELVDEWRNHLILLAAWLERRQL